MGVSTHRDQEEGHDGLPPPQLPGGRSNALEMREASRACPTSNDSVGQEPALSMQGAPYQETLPHSLGWSLRSAGGILQPFMLLYKEF